MRTYGYDRVKLYEHYAADELVQMATALRADPDNANPDRGSGSIALYDKRTMKRLDNIAFAIYFHGRDGRAQMESRAGGAA